MVPSSSDNDKSIFAAEILVRLDICLAFNIVVLSSSENDILIFTVEILFQPQVCLAPDRVMLSSSDGDLLTFATETSAPLAGIQKSCLS
jgi:hypothetical protein